MKDNNNVIGSDNESVKSVVPLYIAIIFIYVHQEVNPLHLQPKSDYSVLTKKKS